MEGKSFLFLRSVGFCRREGKGSITLDEVERMSSFRGLALPQGGGLRGRGAWPGKEASGRGLALGPAEGGGVAIRGRARQGPSAEAGRFLGGS